VEVSFGRVAFLLFLCILSLYSGVDKPVIFDT